MRERDREGDITVIRESDMYGNGVTTFEREREREKERERERFIESTASMTKGESRRTLKLHTLIPSLAQAPSLLHTCLYCVYAVPPEGAQTLSSGYY